MGGLQEALSICEIFRIFTINAELDKEKFVPLKNQAKFKLAEEKAKKNDKAYNPSRTAAAYSNTPKKNASKKSKTSSLPSTNDASDGGDLVVEEEQVRLSPEFFGGDNRLRAEIATRKAPQLDPQKTHVIQPLTERELTRVSKWFSVQEIGISGGHLGKDTKIRPKKPWWDHLRAQGSFDFFCRFFGITRGDCIGSPQCSLGGLFIATAPTSSIGPDFAYISCILSDVSKSNTNNNTEFIAFIRHRFPNLCTQNKLGNMLLLRYGRNGLLKLPMFGDKTSVWTESHRLIMNLPPNDFQSTFRETAKRAKPYIPPNQSTVIALPKVTEEGNRLKDAALNKIEVNNQYRCIIITFI